MWLSPGAAQGYAMLFFIFKKFRVDIFGCIPALRSVTGSINEGTNNTARGTFVRGYIGIHSVFALGAHKHSHLITSHL
jgi:hypothetical protein